METVYTVHLQGYTGSLLPEHWEILRLQDDALFLRYDSVIYLVMVCMLTVFLCWTTLSLSLWSLKSGFLSRFPLV
ncbi:MAG TPA: hypothetical protein PK765_01570 [bacterium]|nr:hypothetical protein [bacterium]